MKKLKPLLLLILCVVLLCQSALASELPDTSPPELQLAIDGSTLTVTANDQHSNISAIYIGSEYFAGNAGTTLEIPLEAYAREEYLYISAEDYAGNVSKTAVVQNRTTPARRAL